MHGFRQSEPLWTVAGLWIERIWCGEALWANVDGTGGWCRGGMEVVGFGFATMVAVVGVNSPHGDGVRSGSTPASPGHRFVVPVLNGGPAGDDRHC